MRARSRATDSGTSSVARRRAGRRWASGGDSTAAASHGRVARDHDVKRVLSSLILVLVLVPLLLLGRWNSEAKAPWSVPVGDVRARLVSTRFLWRPDEKPT